MTGRSSAPCTAFISYRRSDCPDSVGRLRDYLKLRLPHWTIFYDHDSLAPGERFPAKLEQEVTTAEVVLVAIGPRWLESVRQRSLQPGADHVREEVRLAIAADRRIVPVLLERARMPGEVDLAPFSDVAPLAERNAVQVRPDPDFERDVAHLASVLEPSGPPIAHRLRRSVRRWSRTALAATALLLFATAVYAIGADSGLRIPGAEGVRRAIDRYGVSLLRPVPSEEAIVERARDVRKRCVEILKSRQDPEGWYCRGPLRGGAPQYSVWTHNQAMAAELRDGEAQASVWRRLSMPFSERFWPQTDANGEFYGWLGYENCPYTFLEPTLWFHLAAVKALASGHDLSSEDRRLLEARLEEIQCIADLHRAENGGGWNKFPNQANVFQHDPYCSALALAALLDLREASLGWHGDEAARDRLIDGTVRYLLSCYRDDAAIPGWASSHVTNSTIDGLTLMIYAVLLRAERDGCVELPEPLVERVERHVLDLKSRTLAYQDAAGQVYQTFTDHNGVAQTVQESVNFPWYPWAVETTYRLLERMRRNSAPPDQIQEVQRVLGNLVLNLSDEMLDRVEQGNTFLTSELLYCYSVWGASSPPSSAADDPEPAASGEKE